MDTRDRLEWLEADGLGGFASGTASGIRSRRYHALLLAATAPPAGRMVLVNGFDAWVTTSAGTFAISSQRYAPDVVSPDGALRIESFIADPWPRWVYRLDDDTRIEQQILSVHDRPLVVVTWKLIEGDASATLEVRPFLSGRDYHSTHHENGACDRTTHLADDETMAWRPYEGVPAIRTSSNGRFATDPVWYRNFLYTAEQQRGLDATEDLSSPGTFTWSLGEGAARWVVSTEPVPRQSDIEATCRRFERSERSRRSAFGSALNRAADAYIVRRGEGNTIIAGYPWFTDWGRDTFISLPGLCLATGRLGVARDILLEWSGAVSEGMLPNRFPDRGAEPEFNAVDASLWFIIAAQAFLDEAERASFSVTRAQRAQIDSAILKIVEGFSRGTRHGIHADGNGLLAAGAPGVQLTWMDARVDGREITPRIGKPVEIQALWINALAIAGARDARWIERQRTALASFNARFWNPSRGCLYDVIDVNHEAGTFDASLRPNQILAVGGLPMPLVTGARASSIVDVVERELLVPMGLRSLGRDEPGYAGVYGGDPRSRDGAYHQGTAWPWLLAAFGDAVRRVRPADRAGSDIEQLVTTLEGHLAEAGLGHLPEVASGDAPHTPGGCPFQAWSLGTLFQLRRLVPAAAVVG